MRMIQEVHRKYILGDSTEIIWGLYKDCIGYM